MLNVRYFIFSSVSQIVKVKYFFLTVANNTAAYELSEFRHCFLHALMKPRFEPRMKLSKCETFSSSKRSSSSKTSASGVADLNNVR